MGKVWDGGACPGGLLGVQGRLEEGGYQLGERGVGHRDPSKGRVKPKCSQRRGPVRGGKKIHTKKRGWLLIRPFPICRPNKICFLQKAVLGYQGEFFSRLSLSER